MATNCFKGKCSESNKESEESDTSAASDKTAGAAKSERSATVVLDMRDQGGENKRK